MVKVGDKVKVLETASTHVNNLNKVFTVTEISGTCYRLAGTIPGYSWFYGTEIELYHPEDFDAHGDDCYICNNFEPTSFTAEPSEYNFNDDEEAIRNSAANDLKSSWLVNAGNLHAVVAKFIITHPELF